MLVSCDWWRAGHVTPALTLIGPLAGRWPYGLIFIMRDAVPREKKGIILWNVVTLAYSNR